MPLATAKSCKPLNEQRLHAAAKALSHHANLELKAGAPALPPVLPTTYNNSISLPRMGLEKPEQLIAAIDHAALARRFHDAALHASIRPEHPELAHIVDAMEEMRIALLGGEYLLGVRNHLQRRFDAVMAERGVQYMNPDDLRALAVVLPALLREHVQGQALPLLLRQLVAQVREHRPIAVELLDIWGQLLNNQRAYAMAVVAWLSGLLEPEITPHTYEGESASSTTESVPEHAGDVQEDAKTQEEDTTQQHTQSEQPPPQQLPTPSDDTQQASAAESVEQLIRDALGAESDKYLHVAKAYKPYTTMYDEVTLASTLASHTELLQLRARLDEKLALVQSNVARFSARLQRVLLAKRQRSWEFDKEEGMLHSARLARLVASPGQRLIYREEKEAPFKDTIITLLLDNSGSMRGRPITIAALSAEILAKTLERAGVKVEILGFTTRNWKGGQSRAQWQHDGKPPTPGRLNDLLHIIYKPADMPWVKARRNLGLMLKDTMLKENIDGEALLWAESRLLARREKRRILMVISDGAPVDDSTLATNNSKYLDQHLREVIHRLEQSSKLELLAIGIGHDVTRYYKRSVTIRDVSMLGETMSNELIALFT